MHELCPLKSGMAAVEGSINLSMLKDSTTVSNIFLWSIKEAAF